MSSRQHHRRVVLPDRERITATQWARFRDEPRPAGADFVEEFFQIPGALGFREAWEVARAEVLERWTAEHPGTRPTTWWDEAPEPRRRLGGSGDRLSDVLAHGPRLERGIPAEGWWSARWVETYHILHGDPAHTLWNRVHQRAAVPVNPADPPRFESQAVYLARLGLLTEAECQLFERGELAIEPELIPSGQDTP